MAALTPTSTQQHRWGNKMGYTARLGAIADADTLATTLFRIEAVSFMREEAAAAADDLTVSSISGGTITFGVAGTVSGAYVTAIGN